MQGGIEMRLFITYARVDKPYCIQIVDLLDVHDLWYDHSLYAGQRWWQQILKMVDWCEGMIYLLSPESVASEYCRREFEIAQKLGKHIFPVLIHKDTSLPPALQKLQYVDFSNGLNLHAVKQLLNAIYIAERAPRPSPQPPNRKPGRNASQSDVEVPFVMIDSHSGLPRLVWCDVPEGEVTVNKKVHQIKAFRISKYPITNAQFQAFAEMVDGFHNEQWWDYSPEAQKWRLEHGQPVQPNFSGDDHPCENVCWYVAVAFCRWLSEKTGLTITLPTVQQWQRTAQGDDQRPFPWGNDLDTGFSNTRESNLQMTSPVTQYPQGAGPYGAFDLSGNVWEWCLNRSDGKEIPLSDKAERAVRGGSFGSPSVHSRVTFQCDLKPRFYYATIGFRPVWLV